MSFEELYTSQYKKLVQYLVRRYNMRQHQADELAQDVFVKMLQYPEYFHGDVSPQIMFWFARSVISNHFRAREKREDKEVDLVAAVSQLMHGEEIFDIVASRELVEKAKSGVREDWWSVLELKAAGFSYQEIAKVRRKTVPAIKNDLNRARQQARLSCA